MVNGERADHVDRLSEGERRGDDRLRRLVGGHRRTGHCQEPDPLPQPRGKRPPGAPLGDHAVRRRPDPDLRLGSSIGRYPRSSFRLQSMHKVAQGIASSRSGAIWAPQLTQIPYVPFSMRASAASIAASSRPSVSSSV